MTALDRALDRAARRARAPDAAAEAEALLGTPDAAAARAARGRGRRFATAGAGGVSPFRRRSSCRSPRSAATTAATARSARTPASRARYTMTPDEVLALVQAGERLGAKEALFSLGDKPEAHLPRAPRVPAPDGAPHHARLSARGAERVIAESALLPHANPGLMSERDLAALREVNVSMGIMLETTSDRLLGPGIAHDRAPDKVPARRLKTIALAGQAPHPLHHRDPDRHRRDARRAGGRAPRHPRAARAVRPHPGGDRPELPGQAHHPDARRGPTRRSAGPRAHGRGGAPAPRPGHEHPGAAQPRRGGLRRAARRRPQRLGRHLAADARPHQSRAPLAAARASYGA